MEDRLSPQMQKYVIAGVVALIVLTLGGFLFYQYQNSKKAAPQNRANVQEEAKKLAAEVGKVFALPSDEDPTIATITDIDKLKNQPFFAKAKNGDKVLIYPNNKKVILYDPVGKKVLEVAPFNPGTPSAQPSTPSATPSPKP